jgi:hypothetical protein
MWFTTGAAAAQYRMMIAGGGTANSDGFIGMGNNLPTGFVPQCRLHLHQTAGQTFMKFTNGTIGSTAVDGLSIGNTNVGFAFYVNFEPDQPHVFATNDGNPTGNIERMRINAFNINGFIGMGNSANFSAKSQLHINTIGANASGANQLGEVFRTEGPDNLDNNWRLLTGTATGTTQKGRLFTTTVGPLHTLGGNINPVNQNFNIEATQADMVFWANGTRALGTNPIPERMRITSDQFAAMGGSVDVTRVSISRDNNNPIIDPLTMLHIGNPWPNPGIGAHRAWMDVGTYYNTVNDVMYVGQHNVAADRNDAVIAWGDNPAVFGTNAGNGDRLYFRFLNTPVLGNNASGINGLEMSRMVSDGNDGRMSIGNPVGGPFDPGNTLEVISSAGSPRPAGLRFRNLTCASAVNAQCNPASPVFLSVDNNGDVILVPGASGPAGGFGGLCSAALPQLTGDSGEDLAGYNFYLNGNGAGSAKNNLLLGEPCATAPNGKLHVNQSSGSNGTTGIYVTNTDGSTFSGPTYGIYSTVPGQASGSSTGYTGVYSTVSGEKDNFAFDGFANGNTLPGSSNTGGRFWATGPTNNTGAWGISDGPQDNVAGLFQARNTNTASNYGIKAYATHYNATTMADNVGVYAEVDVVGGGTATNNVAVAGIAKLTSGSMGTSLVGIYGEAPAGGNAGQFFGSVSLTGPQIIFSDQRIKTNVEKVSSGLSIVNKLNPVTYDYKVNEYPELNLSKERQYGFIAQEVESVIPELVSEVHKPEFKDKDGKITSKGGDFKGVNYEAMIPVLTRCIQEQQKQIEELKDMVMGLASQKQGSAGQSPTSQVEVELSDKNIVVLNQNVPNPFAESTVITYNIPENTGFAQIIFYNSNGQLIKAVDLNQRGTGQLNVFANDLSSGTYTYTLIVDGKSIDTKRMIKTK